MKYTADAQELPRITELEVEFEILRELGRGGTAVVYLARDRALGRKVAIKVIRPAYTGDAETLARLVREARTIAALQHPNIVGLYGTRRLGDSSVALVMEYVAGWTLKREIESRGALTIERARHVLTDIGRALRYAHRQQIIHRDVKPENIYISDETGLARLSDFGSARPWNAESNLTLPGVSIGTPAYMSPEQIDGLPLDGRSDLYSLALVGYEMLTGKRPWGDEGLFGVIYKQKNQQLPPLAQLRLDAPEVMRAAIEGALRKNPDARWASVDEFLQMLGDAGEAEPGARLPVAGNGAARTSAAERTAQERARRSSDLPRRAQASPRAATEASYGHVLLTPDTAWNPPLPPAAPQVPVLEHAPVPMVTETQRRAWLSLLDPQPAPPAASSDEGMTIRFRRPESPVRAPVRSVRRLITGRSGLAAGVFLAVFAMTAGAGLVLRGGGAEPAGEPAAVQVAPNPAPPAPIRPQTVASPTPVPPAATISYLLLPSERARAGETLFDSLRIRLADGAGVGVPHATVRFRVREGDGVITPEVVTTDERGYANARWDRPTPGMHVVEATVDGLGIEPAAFRSAVPIPIAAPARPGPTRPRVGQDRVLVDLPPSEAVLRATRGAAADVPALSSAYEETGAAGGGIAVQRTAVAGGSHSCALDVEGAAYCWGSNDLGQLGSRLASRHVAQVRVVATEPFLKLAAGAAHSCAIGASGTVFCWGANGNGQLGDGTRTGRPEPVRVQLRERVSSVTVGMNHSCALDTDGLVSCWGDNSRGQLGDRTAADRALPVRAAGRRAFRSISAGWAHTCALNAQGAASCWGSNRSGELGNEGTWDSKEPVPVAGEHQFVSLAAGNRFTCGLRVDGSVLCWGDNTHGQLGNGGSLGSAVPMPVLAGERFAVLTVGAAHACGITRQGAALCWGKNSDGQIGDGSVLDRSRPTPVADGHRFVTLAAATAHTCGTTSAGTILCWGANDAGQVGASLREAQTRPVPVSR